MSKVRLATDTSDMECERGAKLKRKMFSDYESEHEASGFETAKRRIKARQKSKISKKGTNKATNIHKEEKENIAIVQMKTRWENI